MPEIELLLTGYSLATDQGGLGLSTIALIRGRQNILVDTGHQGRRELLLNTLATHGLSPGDIGTVVLTHAHWDHAQNVDVFPNATICIHPKELEYARNPKPDDWATARYFPDTLRNLNVREVQEGEVLESGVRILDTPGHTRGSISVVVETSDGSVVLAGDALTSPGSAFIGKPFLIFWDEREAEESVAKLLKAGRIFYPGHDRPFRLGEGTSFEYLVEGAALRVFGSMSHGSEISVEIAPSPPRQVRVMP